MRATHDGIQEIRQGEILEIVGQKYKLKFSTPTASRIVADLRSGAMGRRWLMPKDGKNALRLFSEAEIIANSSAIKALLLATEIMDSDDWVNHEQWTSECSARLGFSADVFEEFMREYITCGYVIEELNQEERKFRLNPRRINLDSFYLLPARDANLRRRTA